MHKSDIGIHIGLSRGTRGTRSPGNPTHFHSPIPRGMNFGSPRFPDSPAIIPRLPDRVLDPTFHYISTLKSTLTFS